MDTSYAGITRPALERLVTELGSMNRFLLWFTLYLIWGWVGSMHAGSEIKDYPMNDIDEQVKWIFDDPEEKCNGPVLCNNFVTIKDDMEDEPTTYEDNIEMSTTDWNYNEESSTTTSTTMITVRTTKRSDGQKSKPTSPPDSAASTTTTTITTSSRTYSSTAQPTSFPTISPSSRRAHPHPTTPESTTSSSSSTTSTTSSPTTTMATSENATTGQLETKGAATVTESKTNGTPSSTTSSSPEPAPAATSQSTPPLPTSSPTTASTSSSLSAHPPTSAPEPTTVSNSKTPTTSSSSEPTPTEQPNENTTTGQLETKGAATDTTPSTTVTSSTTATTSIGDGASEQTKQPDDPSTSTVSPSTLTPTSTKTMEPITDMRDSTPVTWTLSTTDYQPKTTTPDPSKPKPRTTPRQEMQSTTGGYCEQTCPDDYFEGKHGCLMLMKMNGSYAAAVGSCINLDNGDMISWLDIEPEYEGIANLMRANNMPQYKFWVNGYQSALVRKEKKAQVVYISTTSYLLTTKDSIRNRTAQTSDVGAICKIPKNCLQWTCPTSYALMDAPNMEFDDPQPEPVLTFKEELKYRCKNQTISTERWTAWCTERGSIGPGASLFDYSCEPKDPEPVRTPTILTDGPRPDLTCKMCVQIGTEYCNETAEGLPDVCVCKTGWSGINCWRFPKYCPNTTCPAESECLEQVTHADCVCRTDRCVVSARAYNRTWDMKVLDGTVLYAGPAFAWFLKLVLQLLFPERGNTVQDSLQYMRSIFVSCAGMVYILAGDPGTLKLDIAERRIFSFMFHFPQIMVQLLFALECYHIDCVMKGRSDNKWRTCAREAKKRWDYFWTYFFITLPALVFSVIVWYSNWETHQREYTSFGVANENLGMLGWCSLAYGCCAFYSFYHGMDIVLDENRGYFEGVKRDNRYETSHDPSTQENVDMCWRNLVTVMLGAPVQCAYSISMIATLAWDSPAIKWVNIGLVFLNGLMGAVQTMQCDRKFLGWIRGWMMMQEPLVEDFNELSYLTTSETFAKKGRHHYAEMLRKREAAEAQKRAVIDAKIDVYRRKFEAAGVPMSFLPHAPEQGPEPYFKWEYDPCEKRYMCARKMEWKFIHWTNEFLGARVKCTVSALEACEHVRNGLIDSGFLAGDECSSRQANTMYQEWKQMIISQDKMDYVEPTTTEKAFLDNLGPRFEAEMRRLSVANKLREAPICPKKKRLLLPVMPMFEYSCPEQQEVGPGIYIDQFGFPWEATRVKDVAVMTRYQEARVWKRYEYDTKFELNHHDFLYTDDERYCTMEGQPWEAALREAIPIREAYPEGREVKSTNPRKTELDEKFLDQDRPDFVGPKEPQYHLPLGPLLRRFYLEKIYCVIRNRMWDIHAEEYAKRQQNYQVRQYIAENKDKN